MLITAIMVELYTWEGVEEGRRPIDYPVPSGEWPLHITISNHEWLMEEWDWESNDSEGFDPDSIRLTYGCRKSINWICRVCGNRWKANLRSRYEMFKNCPNKCISEWPYPISVSHPELIGCLVSDVDPNSIYYDSPGKYIWKCIKHDLEFMAEMDVRQALTQRTRCVACRHENGRIPEPLSETEAYLDLDEVQENPYVPYLSVKSKHNAIWKCDKGHRFVRKICRYIYENATCPTCNGKNPGSVLENRPDLAEEWHPDNEEAPDKVSLYSWTNILWQCSKCDHEWEAYVANRTNRGSGCPSCWKHRGCVSIAESRLAEIISTLLGETLITQLGVLNEAENGRYYLDMVTHDNIAIEYDSYYWHDDESDIRRSKYIESKGFTMIHVREHGLEKVNKLDVPYDRNRDTLEQVAEIVVQSINNIRSRS